MPTKSALYKAAVVQIVSLPYLLILRTDQEHCKNCTVIFCINLYLFSFFKRLQIKNDLCYNWSGCNVNNHRHFYGVMYGCMLIINLFNTQQKCPFDLILLQQSKCLLIKSSGVFNVYQHNFNTSHRLFSFQLCKFILTQPTKIVVYIIFDCSIKSSGILPQFLLAG